MTVSVVRVLGLAVVAVLVAVVLTMLAWWAWPGRNVGPQSTPFTTTAAPGR